MKLFRCDHCSNVVYFENTVCESCAHTLGYWHEANMMVSLEVEGDHFTALALPEQQFVYCANAQHGACNWLVAYNPGGDPYCRACRHNALVPDIADPANLTRWQVIERAKKRLFYSLLRFRLPLATRNEDAIHGLSFRFLNEDIAPAPVMTGHESGIITLALKEADDAAREYRRTLLNEPYRTLLGHFRHEIGHHFWDILIGGQPAALDEFHIVDTTEMASAFGVRLNPKIDVAGDLTTRIDFDPYRLGVIEELIEHWVPLSSLINNLNRAVGQHDAYPFVLTPAVVGKLEFIQRIVRDAGQIQWTVPGPNGLEPINRPWQER